MNTGPFRNRAGVWLVAVGILLTPFLGCVSDRSFEIDTTSAKGFRWNGKIVIIERAVPSAGGLFLMHAQRPELRRIELVGENDRNVVIHLKEKGRFGAPLTTIQDVGRAPDRILEALVRDSPDLMRIMENLRKELWPDEAGEEAWERVALEYLQTVAHIQNLEFGKVTAKQIASACAASPTMHVETIYRVDEATLVRATLTDGHLLNVVVEDAEGRSAYS